MKRAGVVLALGALVVLGGADPGWAGQKRQVGDKDTLKQKQRQLKEERARAADARKREASILAEIETLDKQLASKRRQVATLNGRIIKAERQLGDLQVEIGRLESRRTGQEEALARRLRALYRIQSQGGVLPLILSGQDPLTQAVQLRHLTTMTAVDARAIREYRVTSEGLADRRVKVDVARKELALLRNEADQERAAADQDAARRRVLLAKVRDERAYHDRMVGELSEATRRMEAFLRELQARQRRVARATPTPERSRPGTGDPTAGLGSLRGRLGWPAEGKVVGEFGPQVHPKFGTRTFRSGIEIDVPEGTSIVAVHPGHVVFTGWFRGYGNLIIVDHGGESYTLYGHAAEIRVSEGDDVRQGQSLGTVGDTGSPGGPRLYFEVRHMGKAVDPLGWLRPRG